MEVIKKDGTTTQFDVTKISEAILTLFCGVGELFNDEKESLIDKIYNNLVKTLSRLKEIIEQFFKNNTNHKEAQERYRMHSLVIGALLLSCVNNVTVTFLCIAVVILAMFIRRNRDRESEDPSLLNFILCNYSQNFISTGGPYHETRK